MTPSREIDELAGEGYSSEHEQQRINQAMALGFEIFRPDSHELTFDLDDYDAMITFRERVVFLVTKNLIQIGRAHV